MCRNESLCENSAIEDVDEKQKHTVVVEIPAPQGLLGLAPVISVLLIGAAWGAVGIGYLCVSGSVVGAVLAVVCAVMNAASGSVASFALCMGIAISCLGLCVPCWHASQAGRRLLLCVCRRKREV